MRPESVSGLEDCFLLRNFGKLLLLLFYFIYYFHLWSVAGDQGNLGTKSNEMLLKFEVE